MKPYPVTSYQSLREPHPARAVSHPDREQVDHSIKFLKKTFRQMRRATRKSDPYKRPAPSPALTPYMRGEIDTILARLKEFAITYSLEKDRACKNPHYITDATTATLAALEKNILTTCRKYGQLHRIASADVSTPHTRE